MNSLLKNLIIVSSILSVSLSGSTVDSVENAKKFDDCRDSFVYRRDLGFVESNQDAFNTFMHECVVNIANDDQNEEVSTDNLDSDDSSEGNVSISSAVAMISIPLIAGLMYRYCNRAALLCL